MSGLLASSASNIFKRAVRIGGHFDQRDEILRRLQQEPSEEARQESRPTPRGPAPSRWSLRTIRASLPDLTDYCLSGV